MASYHNRGREIAERLIKLREYLFINATSTHAVKATDILAYLASVGHEVEIKTVYRDIETLKDFLGLDLCYDGRQKGYLLLNPPFEPYELRSIVNSIQAAKFITQQEADNLTQKIMGLADKYTRPSLNRQTFVHNRVRTIHEKMMKNLDIIYEAIAQDRKIGYKYFHHTSDRDHLKWYTEIDGSTIITTSPYGVHWNGDSFSILAFRRTKEKDKIYILQLDRMDEIKILSDVREGKNIAQKYLKYGFGNTKSTPSPSMKTKLRVDGINTDIIVDKFGENISITPIGEDYFIATIDERPTPELYLWTVRFRPHIEIIFPEDAEVKLRKYFAEISEGKKPLPPFL